MSKPSDLVQGMLNLLIMKILILQPLHGWAISQRLKQVSSDVLQVSDGSLYPALHKLEQEGWIAAEWKNQRARSARQVLFAHASRPQAVGERNRAVATPVLGQSPKLLV
jgi:PadR family transcriptional regulator